MHSKSRSPGYIPNDHWVICQRSGKVIRASDAVREWTGLIVARDKAEPRHPQDFVRAKEDHQEAKGVVNTEPTDSFVLFDTAIVGKATAGVAVVNSTSGFTEAGLTSIPAGTFNGNTL